MDKVRNPNICVCYTPSSEPYSIYLLLLLNSEVECDSIPPTFASLVNWAKLSQNNVIFIIVGVCVT
jgi:hypothetical protein